MNMREFVRMPVWYPVLGAYSFPTVFINLSPDEIKALHRSETQGSVVIGVISRLKQVMSTVPGHCFLSVDECSPTDTERFATKRGAVYSPESAWNVLIQSQKIKAQIDEGKVTAICVKPYRNMTRAREFRLFIQCGELKAMSQYWLTRHYRRLEGVKHNFWNMAQKFVHAIAWSLPYDSLVMDIYFTGDNEIMVLDINPWGEPTNPLLLRTWVRDWSQPEGIFLMPPPLKISGNVNVSF